MKQHRIIRFSGLFLLLGVLFGLAACNDWTEMEAVDNNVKKPWEQDPALWAEYTAALRDYKKSEHFIVYARLHNSPEPAASEKDFMRCLPDSLDIVARVDDPEALKRMVVGGVGVSILSALAVEQEVASGTLLAFEMDRSALKRDIYLITLRGRSFTRTEQKFIDFLKSCKRKRKHDITP